ncbi:MAG: hypothetical protein CV045_10960 [Cyanobacteria bacterium M5B4]|nr:MAG: hypothetical protein CV045_10960 [Cyanobacteria bacterium M5B4]
MRRMLVESYSALAIGDFIREQSIEAMEAILTGETPLEIKPVDPAVHYMEKLSKGWQRSSSLIQTWIVLHHRLCGRWSRIWRLLSDRILSPPSLPANNRD